MIWEILVPTIHADGSRIVVPFHQQWDAKVRAIANGLTILSPAKGQWISPSGTLFRERMIPVRIFCTEEQIEQIARMTIEHYDQEAVMYYRVSADARIMYR